MKKRVFRDILFPVFLIVEIFVIILELGIAGVLVYAFSQYGMDREMYLTYIAIIALLILTFQFFFNSPRVLDRAFGRLTVYNDCVVYKCFLRPTRKLYYVDCAEIGVENYEALNRGLPVVRGDETSFIYFSKEGYPSKFHMKISLVKNSRKFLKTSYSDALCEELIKVIPEEKSAALREFYAKMIANDKK